MPPSDELKKRLSQDKTINILHGAIGLSTESGELLDALKKHIYYGSELDIPNIKEELGDLFFYMALISRELDISFNEIMHTNIEKLKARYSEKFTQHEAENRDLTTERKILEK